MKLTTVAAIVVALLITAGGAVAATSLYWTERGKTYVCEGTERSVFCKETNWRGSKYGVAIIPSQVSVTYGGRLIFNCDRPRKPRGNCTYYGP